MEGEPPAAHAQAANAAIVSAICGGEPEAIGAWTTACVGAGLRSAEAGERTIAAESFDAKASAAADAGLARRRE